MKKIIFISLFLFVILSCNHKKEGKKANKLSDYKLSQEVASLVDSLAVMERISETVRFQDLIKKATISDLVYLTDHKKPEIRCYSFLALANRNYPNIQKVFLEHVKDTAIVISHSGCIIDHLSVMEYMLDQLHPAYTNQKFRFDRKTYDKYYKIAEENRKGIKIKPQRDFNDTIEKLKHNDLRHTETYYWADSDDKDFFKQRKLINKPIIIHKLDNNIFVTAYFEVNSCNAHFPNIIRKGDTIILKDQLLHKYPCDKKSKMIEKINFLIADFYIPEIKTVIAEKY